MVKPILFFAFAVDAVKVRATLDVYATYNTSGGVVSARLFRSAFDASLITNS